MNKRYITALSVFAVSVCLLSACSKSEPATKKETEETTTPTTPATLPTVTTIAFSSITTTSATTGGTVPNNGGAAVTERGICYSLTPNPTIENTTVPSTSVSGSGSFVAQLSNLTAATKYYVRAFAKNKAGIGYGDEIILTTASIINATFKTSPMFIIGSTTATLDVEVLTDGGASVSERGICWATTANPTVESNKIKHNSTGLGKYRTMVKALSEKTTYHFRAYAINTKGISYGEDIEFKTIPKGKLTYTFNESENPSAEMLAAYARLQVAIDSAVWYIENYTSATKHIYLNYVDGTPTADANNEGWMRFGTNSSYQNLRTMLHEIDHTLGTGTSSWWNGKIVGGKFQGEHTNIILNKIQNTTDAQLSGDSQHWWPYGLNQNSEVTSSWDYVYNCLIVEAMRKDGLTMYSGPYTP